MICDLTLKVWELTIEINSRIHQETKRSSVPDLFKNSSYITNMENFEKRSQLGMDR